MWTMRDHGCTKIHSHPEILFLVIETKQGITFCGKIFRSVDEAKQHAESIFLNKEK